MKIAIIGAGIYGCHLALVLKNKKYDVDLYDMSDDIFSGASTHNSFRIHKGYHYPRSGKTREMCMRDEAAFIKNYAHLTSPGKYNPKLFCIADDHRTLMDYKTMKIIMSGSGLPFEERSLKEITNMGFANIEQGFLVHEAILMVDKAKKWFKKRLREQGVNIKLNTFIRDVVPVHEEKINVLGLDYDFVLNCTYNQGLQHDSKKYDHFFDLCFSLILVSKNKKEETTVKSFGIFDGAYPSLEPFGYEEIPEQYNRYRDRKLFQLFHVKHTSVKKYVNINAVRTALKNGLSGPELLDISQKIIDDTLYFYPKFHDELQVIGHNLSIKNKNKVIKRFETFIGGSGLFPAQAFYPGFFIQINLCDECGKTSDKNNRE